MIIIKNWYSFINFILSIFSKNKQVENNLFEVTIEDVERACETFMKKQTMSYSISKEGHLVYQGGIVLGFDARINLAHLDYYEKATDYSKVIEPKLLVKPIDQLCYKIYSILESAQKTPTEKQEELTMLQNKKGNHKYVLIATKRKRICFTYYNSSLEDLDALSLVFSHLGFSTLLQKIIKR